MTKCSYYEGLFCSRDKDNSCPAQEYASTSKHGDHPGMLVNRALNCKWRLDQEVLSLNLIAEAKDRIVQLVDVLMRSGQSELWDDVFDAGADYARAVLKCGEVERECSKTYAEERSLRNVVSALFDDRTPNAENLFDKVFPKHLVALVQRWSLTGEA